MTSKSEVAKTLRDIRSVDSLILLPDNPRHGDIGALSQSLERFGQQKPIVINSAGVILAGNHTYQAAQALGWTEIWVTESDLEGTEQPGFALADNRLSDLATYDHDLLLQQLREQPDLLGTGYGLEDLDEVLARSLSEGATGLAPDRSFPEKLMNWEAQGGTRSVVLLYEVAEYRAIVEKLAELGREWNLGTHSAIVARLLGVEDNGP